MKNQIKIAVIIVLILMCSFGCAKTNPGNTAAASAAERSEYFSQLNETKKTQLIEFFENTEKELGVKLSAETIDKIAKTVVEKQYDSPNLIITYEIAETAGIIDDGYIGKLNRELVEKIISESSSFDEVCQRIDAVGDYSVSNWGSGVRNIVYYAYKDGARDGFISITLGGIKDTYISYNNVILCTPSDFVSENVEQITANTNAAGTGAERADDVAAMLPSNIKPETFYAFIDRYENELGVTFDHDKRLKIAEAVKQSSTGFAENIVLSYGIAYEMGIIDDSYTGVLTRDLVQKYKSESKNFTEVLTKINQSGEYPLFIFIGSGMNHFAYPLYENGVRSGTLLIEPDARPAIILYQTGPDAPEEILCSESDFAN